ncbi:methyltransferase [Bodo saltans virus]|uniref:Methyltransferase n=1 Tax=Bodo saltans virus TaxID=2024608 RepID=A0A2H4UUL2_9VIRU|nr:methyltransferase [Bodo saltans virus]ATZ80610.1 methyltransferase [Bodo saltans virus]
MQYNILEKCRLCECEKIIEIFSLGDLVLTGVFPLENEKIPVLPLSLCKCVSCGLVQLYHNFDVSQLYGDTYGYRSGLNNSMVVHLHSICDRLSDLINLDKKNDYNVLDIGSSDGTLLNRYKNRENGHFVGIDPSSVKYKQYYNKDIEIISDFFCKDKVKGKKFDIITTISMFYDLPNPLQFAMDIYDALDDDGLWFTEQSYFVFMLKTFSFDTICQEHIEYYCLKQLKYIADKVGLKIVDIGFNDINGGSFSCCFAKKTNNKFQECSKLINETIQNEEIFLATNPIDLLSKNIILLKNKMFNLFEKVKNNNESIHGYGASTKGNVLLQYFGVTNKDIKFISEINDYKYNRYTPGTNIKIISEKESKEMKPEYYFILPWHFKDNIINKETEYLKNGGKLIFPLPFLDIVSYDGNNVIHELL